ncbi:hypothetical protein BOH66_04095 [Microbacterium aurum]|uniref:Uncharacterized protein n=1 Tax=Microbacterium aurum TaxID=36805 RepID=A0A1P8U619_9MICO|nr:permease prefix domain 1-containing protein [Microbacterium aurum]APZ33544.1 hypothetical protein BOH66_04095 [Microbacterium aurum]MBM7827232.1 hypothetical protein [Microbacterium aurum]
MTATLTDRYVLAVTRSIPEQQRADVADELRASIADQLDARIEAGEPADAAERAVLTELGDPDRLAAGYADRPLSLIGPRYFLEWKRLLILLLWIVPACAAVAVAIAQIIAGATVGEVIGQVVAVTLSVVVHVGFWVTLVFAVLERTTGATGDPLIPWSVDSLPEPRETGARLSDLVGGIVWVAILAGAIVWDLTIGFVYLHGSWMSFLNPGLWPGWAVVLGALMAGEIVLAVLAYRRGRWTMGLAVANTVLAIVSASVLLWMLGAGLLVNPALYDIVIAAGAGADLPQVVGAIVAVGIVGVALWDAVDGFVKARRGRVEA